MRLLLIGILFITPTLVFSQQVSDTTFSPEIPNPRYTEIGTGSTVYIDRTHQNFHTLAGRYRTFGNVLTKDGYVVESFDKDFTKTDLSEIGILVISNALAENARGPFVIPTPSAFQNHEIEAVRQWVMEGGALLLIADHMPFAGASAELAQAFGFTFYDSFLMNADTTGFVDYSRQNGRLANHPILAAQAGEPAIDSVLSFTGQGFAVPEGAFSLLNPSEDQTLYLTDTMWVFHEKTPTLSGAGLSQGAIMPYGKGRIAVFGEAAMFTGQLAGPQQYPVGMNSPDAPQNYRFLLRIIHWLDGEEL